MSDISDEVSDHVIEVMNNMYEDTCFEPRTGCKHDYGKRKPDVDQLDFYIEFEWLDQVSPYVEESVDLEIGFKTNKDLRARFTKTISEALSDKVLDAVRDSGIYNIRFILGHKCLYECDCSEKIERMEKWKALQTSKKLR